MHRLISWPTLAGGIVFAAVLTSLAPKSSSLAHAQISVRIERGGYYNPYGQGPYGGYVERYDRGYDQRYAAPYDPRQGARYSRGAYAYPGYTNAPYRNGYSYGYRSAPYVRFDDRSIYYQPTYRPIYVPYGYRPF